MKAFAQRYGIGADVGIAVGVVLLLAILMLPLPTGLLDVGLALSVTNSVLILMVSVFIRSPLEFTSFPFILLLTTLLRLSLNVATTRLILSHGHEGMMAAGKVVAAFGGFLMGGDFVIGIIVFAILLVVNFMVITKGSSRIAEVGARFSLDAMPGKQMAIDADLSAGIIDQPTARARRRDLEAESAFHGAMDGAAKFVRGDAVAGLIITGVNIFGGLAIGLIRHGMSFGDAAASFTTLTIGDGLVTQVPALLVSTAAGIVVTKADVEDPTKNAVVEQLGNSPKALALAAIAAVVLGLMPGLPTIPFFGLGALAGSAAWFRGKHRPQAEVGPQLAEAGPSEPPLSDSLRVDSIRIELGYGLLGLAGAAGAKLTDQIRGLRRSIAAEMGFVLPPVRIQDNLQLGADSYVLKIKELPAGTGELRPARLLAMDPKGGVPSLAGEPGLEPVFGLQALWIEPDLKNQALFEGYTVVDPGSVLITHLTEVVREAMPELLSYAETQKLLNELPTEHQRLVSDLVPTQLPLSTVQRILQTLLAERVSIRDLPTILEGISEAAAFQPRSVATIVAHVRTRLARQLSDACATADGTIPVITISTDWETVFAESLVGAGDDRHLAMAPGKLNEFIQRLRVVLDAAMAAGESPTVLTSSGIRAHVRAISERFSPATSVLAQTEIARRARLRTLGTV